MKSVGAWTKDFVRDGLHRVGLNLQRYSPATVPEARLRALLAHHGVDLVLDVGANAGQYARMLRRVGYTGGILSFEPLRDAWEACAAQAAHDPRWAMAARAAIGAENGQVEIHVAGNSVSSSILPMHDKHRDAAPASAYVGSEIVDVRRLDHAAKDAVDGSRHPFLKVDAQGYERQVIEGASGIVGQLTGVQLEMSLVTLYEGGATFMELLEGMQQAGFAPFALLPGFTDLRSGRLLQVDGLFFRD